MSATKLLHHLTQVDRENRTAVCFICGPTKITVAKSRPNWNSKVSCFNKAKEGQQESRARRRDLKRSQNPNWKPRHSLSHIDVKKMRAICSVCGSTDIRKRIVYRKYTVYLCAIKKRAYARQYRLTLKNPLPLKPI